MGDVAGGWLCSPGATGTNTSTVTSPAGLMVPAGVSPGPSVVGSGSNTGVSGGAEGMVRQANRNGRNKSNNILDMAVRIVDKVRPGTTPSQ